jgi:Tol biopolymer transport system component
MDDLKVELAELKEESDPIKLAGTHPAVPSTRRAWVWAAAAMVIVVIALATWLFRGTARKPQNPPEVVPLTSYAGSEQHPSFSPDGNQVAFSWNGEKQDNFDIYLKLIGSPTPLRLTTDPAEDVSPAFSPDGRSIGFIRVSKERTILMVIPAIGGPECVITDLPRHSFSWVPDGKWIVTDGLTFLSTESGEMRSLTSPPMKSSPDFSPAVSPNGRTVAFSRGFGAQIYLLDLTEDLKPKGAPRRLTSLNSHNLGSAWTANGEEIVFFAYSYGIGASLWRVPVSGARDPERLPFGVGEASCPAVSRSGNRLVYQREMSDANIWRLSLSGPGVASGPPVRLIASTRMDAVAQYSPDGMRIAFESDRSGVKGIWVIDAEGSKAVELLSGQGSTPRWSPDGQRVAFDFSAETGIGPIRTGRIAAGESSAKSWSSCTLTGSAPRGLLGFSRLTGRMPFPLYQKTLTAWRATSVVSASGVQTPLLKSLASIKLR